MVNCRHLKTVTDAKGMIDPILTRNVFICGRKCRIFHEGQFVKECRAYGRRNHGTGDVSCPAKNNEDNITAFSSCKIPLSNMYPVELKIEDETFNPLTAKLKNRNFHPLVSR